MHDADLQTGGWYVSSTTGRQLLRYEGRNNENAFVFSKFSGDDPELLGKLLGTVEIYNVEPLEPYRR